ncbi:MAG: STAS domain-containing protein [Methylococcales bacterium]|nr:STAS domain-containing protein [Methylococcales bacterium]
MNIKKTVSEDKKTITLEILSDLTLEVHEEFRQAYINEPTDTLFIIDFTHTEMVDSSGLSLLLLLIDFSTAPKQSIILTGCNERVMSILKIASFKKLFTIR